MDLNHIEHSSESVASTGIKHGQHYVAQRNGPARLLTCSSVEDGVLYSQELSYAYNTSECFLVSKEIFNKLAGSAESDFQAWQKDWYKTRLL